jgi:hypothetical protein
LNIKQKDLENLPDQVINHVVVNFLDNFPTSLNNKYFKFNGCTITCNEHNEFSLKTTFTPSNISFHSNIANLTNTIGAVDTSLLVLYRNNPNISDRHYCINQNNCHKCTSCFKCCDYNKCLNHTDHYDCDKFRANINVNSLPRYDDYISTVNNYFV